MASIVFTARSREPRGAGPGCPQSRGDHSVHRVLCHRLDGGPSYLTGVQPAGVPAHQRRQRCPHLVAFRQGGTHVKGGTEKSPAADGNYLAAIVDLTRAPAAAPKAVPSKA